MHATPGARTLDIVLATATQIDQKERNLERPCHGPSRLEHHADQTLWLECEPDGGSGDNKRQPAVIFATPKEATKKLSKLLDKVKLLDGSS